MGGAGDLGKSAELVARTRAGQVSGRRETVLWYLRQKLQGRPQQGDSEDEADEGGGEESRFVDEG